MKQLFISAVLAAACGIALAKLPVPVLDDAAKAKAAEAAAKTAWAGKSDAYLLCKAQDKVAAHYRKTAGAAAPTAPTDVAVAAAPATTPCADPGPFAYTPAEQKPIEASGAHSPTGTAISPPSTTTPAAATPAKKS